ncbi:MAG: CRTAC1 family protein [Acidobacteria bacterium]|nr:CRTAC1 family protein [Acidobacteriota bacterium]
MTFPRSRKLLAASTLAALAWLSRGLWGQGVVSTQRAPRPSPQAKTSLPLPKVHFVDVAAAAGLKFQHMAGDGRKRYILEAVGSGVAIFDYDNDGRPDIFLVNGSKFDFAPGEARPTGRLFRNLGRADPNDPSSLRFEDVTEKAGVGRSGWGFGACVGDYDNDGHEDLFVTYYGSNVLYHNNGDGTFRDATAEAGLPTSGNRWGTGCSFFDYDRDGRLDLAAANYVQFDRSRVPTPGENQFCVYKGLPVMCGPRGLPGGVNILYHNEGGGKFKDVSEKSGFNKPAGYYSFTVLTGDFDNDGWPDAYISTDSTPNILLHNNHDGTFTDIGVISGPAFNEDGQEQAGMGVSAADYNHDGWLDIVKTNFSDDTPSLYLNNKDSFFIDVTYRAGLGVNNRFLGWGVGFIDVDHDGWKDIFMVNGHVYPGIDKLQSGSPYRQQRNLYWNVHNGAFLDISSRAGPAMLEAHSSRGAAFGDLNNDGALEVVVNNIDESPSLLVNQGEKMNWLLVKARGTRSNRDGIGARVTVKAGELQMIDEIRSGGSFLSHNDMRLHYGLGNARQADWIRVRWPSGLEEVFPAAPANREALVEEGKGKPVAERPRPVAKSK